MNYTDFTIVRHGESEWNVNNRIQGQYDVQLTDIGIEQSKITAQYLKDEPFDSVWSSDLRRTSYLGKLLAKNLSTELNYDSGLRELNAGILQGKLPYEAAALYPDLKKICVDDPEFEIPGGESYKELWERVVSTFNSIAEKKFGRKVAIVSHGGAIRVLLKHAMDYYKEWIRPEIVNCAISRFRCYENLRWQLIEWNNSSHLGNTTTLDDKG